jgi:hypothetical protein
MSAYLFFSGEERARQKEAHPEYTFGELVKAVKARWKAMTPEEKAPFFDGCKRPSTARPVYRSQGRWYDRSPQYLRWFDRSQGRQRTARVEKTRASPGSLLLREPPVEVSPVEAARPHCDGHGDGTHSNTVLFNGTEKNGQSQESKPADNERKEGGTAAAAGGNNRYRRPPKTTGLVVDILIDAPPLLSPSSPLFPWQTW